MAHSETSQNNNPPGQVYFVRHGESTSNERNIFAGVLDVALTPYGRLQARRAGIDIKKKGVKFDAVYVSHMRRARETCEIALAESQALRSPDVPIQIDTRISERSQGIFTKRNKNLVRLALGYESFEEMLHSHNEAPPGGEKIAQVYTRVASFYEERIIPHLKRGENVLVVCHEYVLEPLSVYLSGLPPTAYKRLKLPNAKALSRDDLIKFRDYESGGMAILRKKVNDLSTMWAIALYAIAFLLGSFVKAISASAGIPSNLFIAITVSGLAIATFYTYLSIDFKGSKGKVSQAVKNLVYLWMLVRWGAGLLLIFSGFLYHSPEDLYKVLWVLFWMVPPALTSPVLSLLWGGNLYPAAILSRTLSVIAPVALIATFAVSDLPINVKGLNFFYLILIVGLAIPAVIAQVWRSRSPVNSNHHSNEWKFIGVLAVVLMNCAIGFQFTPLTLISDIFFSTDIIRTTACLQQLIMAVLIFVLIRILAAFTSVISKRWLTEAEAQDAYILLTNPNFLLWAALFSGVSTTANLTNLHYAIFWAALGFYCIPFVDQILLVNASSSDLLRETLRSSRMATEDIKKLFLKLDADGSNQLDRKEIVEFLGLIEDLTVGERTPDHVREHIADYLFTTLDANKDGTVSLKELEDYVSMYGLVANLNVAQA